METLISQAPDPAPHHPDLEVLGHPSNSGTKKTNTTPVKVKKYTVTLEAKQGIKVQIDRLLEAGILVPGHSIIAS